MRYRLTGIAVAVALTVAFILTGPSPAIASDSSLPTHQDSHHKSAVNKHFWHTVIPLSVGSAFILFIVLESQRVKRKEKRASDRHS